MFAWAPLITGLLTAIAVRRRVFNTDRGDDLIRALLLATALWGAYLALVTEVLSLFTALRFGPLLAAWTLPIPLLLWWLRGSPRAPRVRLFAPLRGDVPFAPIREDVPFAPLRGDVRPAPWPAGILAFAAVIVAIIVAVTGLVALYSMPNTWDSMTYHLPRVMHWAQNGSIAHYPTHEPRQLYLSPWAEMVACHFYILSGGDRAARLIQWLAMAGSLLAVSTIAGRLGAGTSGRILSVLVAATIPMGLLQAVSTQTDYTVSFHLLAAVCFLSTAERRVWPCLTGAALATGLAMLTKGTTYVVLAPFLAAFAWRLLWTKRAAARRPLLVFAALVLALNLGHFSRNIGLFASPLQPRDLGEYHRYGNETHGVAVTISNAARFAALHLSVPAPTMVAKSYQAIRDLHRFLGVDPEDPRTTWPGMRFEPTTALIHEDFSGNFPHSVLILVCFAAACSGRVRRTFPGLARHACLVAAGCLLFAALLKWTPWSTRLHLPLFLLAAPVIGTILSRQSRYLATATVAALVVQAVPYVAQNPLHELTGQNSVFQQAVNDQMFRSRPLLGEFYLTAADQVAAADCPRLGFDMPPDTWEYPLWVVLGQASGTPPRLEGLGAGNVSQRLLDLRFEPCAVVCLNCAPPRRKAHSARFGEPVLVAPDDLTGKEKHLLFLADSDRRDKN